MCFCFCFGLLSHDEYDHDPERYTVALLHDALGEDRLHKLLVQQALAAVLDALLLTDDQRSPLHARIFCRTHGTPV
jgi:hypothetical protein